MQAYDTVIVRIAAQRNLNPARMTAYFARYRKSFILIFDRGKETLLRAPYATRRFARLEIH